MQKCVLFRRIHGQVVFARAAGIHEFENDVLANSFQIAPAPGFPGIGCGGTPALFHRPVVSSTHGMRVHLIGRAPHDVHAAAIGLPTRNAGGIMLVGVCDATVVLFFKVVIREVGITAPPKPELLDSLLALFVGIKLKEGFPLLWRNDIDDVLIQPLLVLAVELFQRLACFGFLSFSLLFVERLRRRRIRRILGLRSLLSWYPWNKDGKRECSSNQGTNYPWH